MPLIRRWGFFAALATFALILLYQPSFFYDWYTPGPPPPNHPIPDRPPGGRPRPGSGLPPSHPEHQDFADRPPHPPSNDLKPVPIAEEPSTTTATTAPLFSVVPLPTGTEAHWSKLPEKYPVTSLIALPSGQPVRIPKIQHAFPTEDREAGIIREERLQAVKKSFERSWAGYKKNAWLKDELTPMSGGHMDTFCGWAATLVDTLDTLWIMGLHAEFEAAVDAVKEIDFTTTPEDTINVFETTIRYLGGLLGAHDLSSARYPVLLAKAVEMGDILYSAFDTPNRMPVTRWDWKGYIRGEKQRAGNTVLIAELGSLSIEFTRLAQLTGDSRYFDAIQRITDELDHAQSRTKLPGMWPIMVDATGPTFSMDNTFTLGGMADSVFEYLPKEYLLLGGLSDQYRKLYVDAVETAKKYVFFRPLTKDNRSILLSGDANVSPEGNITLNPRAQHLACFTGGMVAIGARIFNRPDELDVARKLTDGCIWAYESMVTGIMPEIFYAAPCTGDADCAWSTARWHAAIAERHARSGNPLGNTAQIELKIKSDGLQPGIVAYDARKYILRPEAIESVFILYRVTGNTSLLDTAWNMFTAIERHTATDLANAAIDDVTADVPRQSDRMESFWLAETLKYFYLIFSDPGVVSLDEYILNTEAHPLKRPQPE